MAETALSRAGPVPGLDIRIRPDILLLLLDPVGSCLPARPIGG